MASKEEHCRTEPIRLISRQAKLTVCSLDPSVQAGCQKQHRGYEQHWNMGCHSDPHIAKKEDQYQEQSLSEEFFFFFVVI